MAEKKEKSGGVKPAHKEMAEGTDAIAAQKKVAGGGK